MVEVSAFSDASGALIENKVLFVIGMMGLYNPDTMVQLDYLVSFLTINILLWILWWSPFRI